MYICVCIIISVEVYTYTHIHIYVYIYIHIYISCVMCMYLCRYVYVHIHIHIRVNIKLHTENRHTNTEILNTTYYIYKCMRVYIYGLLGKVRRILSKRPQERRPSKLNPPTLQRGFTGERHPTERRSSQSTMPLYTLK